MRLLQAKEEVTFTLTKEEALVLFEMLQRLVEDNEKALLPLLHSSAEFAVLCRMNSHLEKTLAEPLRDNYEALLLKARKAILRQSGVFEGIEEK
jgi:hypothetical protein